MNVQALIDQLSFFYKIMMPNRSLKYFPPDFTLRNPMSSLLNSRLKQGKEVYLTVYRIDFAYLEQEVPQEIWNNAAEFCRNYLRLDISDKLGEQQVIAIDQFSKVDFVLLSEGQHEKGPGPILPLELKKQLDSVHAELERKIADCIPIWRNCFKILTATIPLTATEEVFKADELLKNSYQAALALATGIVSPDMGALRNQMLQLLDQGSISVLAQPIMNLVSGDVHGWEILTRGPENSVLHYPDELFRFASQTQLLSRLEFLVMDRAFEEISSRAIKEPVFLNVTAVTLSHPLFLSHVLQLLVRHSTLSPKQIYFEITERHQIANMKAMIEILRTYREHGFRFAVDDAGSGYSSLQWIGELVPDLIKVDRSVIQHVDRIAIKESLLRAIVTAAKEMNCELVAEGVEREEEADILFRLDVTMGQGFYFARPNVLLNEDERGMFQETKLRIQSRRELAAS